MFINLHKEFSHTTFLLAATFLHVTE